MGDVIDVYGPPLMLALFGLTVVALCLVGLWHLGRTQAAKIRRYEQGTKKHLEYDDAMRACLDTASAAIDIMIGEISAHPASYATMPDDVQKPLFAAHDSIRSFNERTPVR